jgi:hypothetical protein
MFVRESHDVELMAEDEPREGGVEDVGIGEGMARSRIRRAVEAVADRLRRRRLRRLPPLEPIRQVTVRLRMVPGGVVHRGDLDTGQGIATVCGKYALHGQYEVTEDPVGCQMCLRSLARQESQAAETRHAA